MKAGQFSDEQIVAVLQIVAQFIAFRFSTAPPLRLSSMVVPAMTRRSWTADTGGSMTERIAINGRLGDKSAEAF